MALLKDGLSFGLLMNKYIVTLVKNGTIFLRFYPITVGDHVKFFMLKEDIIGIEVNEYNVWKSTKYAFPFDICYPMYTFMHLKFSHLNWMVIYCYLIAGRFGFTYNY